MDHSVLFERQTTLGAEFGDFHNRRLPKWYTSIREEYRAARNGLVVLDRTYCGQLAVSGNDHLDLLHRLTTNEMRNLQPGQGQVNIFANEKGRIIERVILQKLDSEVRLTTSPGNSRKVVDWIDKYTFIEDVKVDDDTSNSGVLSLFGPESPNCLAKLFEGDFVNLPAYHFVETRWNKQRLLITSTTELGFPGFDLTTELGLVPELWDLLLDQGAEYEVQPMGEAAYEVLRIEAGWPLYGKDYGDSVNPHEAGMVKYLDFDKGCYIGQEVIARLDTYEKVQKYLTGVVLQGDSLPNHNDKVLIGEQEVGRVTSAVHSMRLGKNVALAYVRTKFIGEGASVFLQSDGQDISGTLVSLPFEVKHET